jgi:hypothetical protein
MLQWVLNGLFDKKYIKIILYIINKTMFEDIRKFVSLTEKSNFECIQNYVPLVFPSSHPEEVNYYKDARICLNDVEELTN